MSGGEPWVSLADHAETLVCAECDWDVLEDDELLEEMFTFAEAVLADLEVLNTPARGLA